MSCKLVYFPHRGLINTRHVLRVVKFTEGEVRIVLVTGETVDVVGKLEDIAQLLDPNVVFPEEKQFKPISPGEAMKKGICRLCGEKPSAPFTSDFAHQACVDRLEKGL